MFYSRPNGRGILDTFAARNEPTSSPALSSSIRLLSHNSKISLSDARAREIVATTKAGSWQQCHYTCYILTRLAGEQHPWVINPYITQEESLYKSHIINII